MLAAILFSILLNLLQKCIKWKAPRRLMILMRKSFAEVDWGHRCMQNECMLGMLAWIICYLDLCSANERMTYEALKLLEKDRCTFILSQASFWHLLFFSTQSPSTVGEERQYNPFLRSHSADLHLALGLQQFHDEDWTQFRARVLEELRKRKDLYNRR